MNDNKHLLAATIGVLVGVGATQMAQAQSDTSPVGLEEIVVTAQHRQESLQRAAIAVTAIQGEDLIGATTAEDIGRIAPALTVQPVGGSGINFYLRGVGTQSGNSFGENAVGFNFNGVYIARPTAPVGTFFDLERVEVLKGPQGTLYGRNATGGAVNVLPAKPVIGEFSGKGSVDFGNYDKKLANLALNLPMGESAALRLAGQVAKRDGYLSDGYQDEDGQALRASLLFEPNDQWSVNVVGDYFIQEGKGTGSVLLSDPALGIDAPPIGDRIGGADPRSLAAIGAFASGAFAPPYCGGPGNWINSGCLVTPGDDGFLDNKYYGLSATIEGNLDIGTLTIIPAYRKTETDFRFYVPGFLGDIQEDADQTSLEVRLASHAGERINYVMGAYYFEESQDAINAFRQGDISHNRFSPHVDTESKAIFGQLTFDVSDTFRLVGGLRYTDESREQLTSIVTGGRPDTTFPADGPFPPFPAPFPGDLDFEELTWKAGIEWDLGPESLLYANVATGFKAGGFFVAGPPDNTFEPEELTAYTIGSKNRFLDNRLQLNVEAFYWDYENQQIGFVGGVRDQDGIAVNSGVVVNAGQATMQGVELELLAAVTENDRFGANVQYLDGEYDTLRYDAFSGPGIQPPTGCNVRGSELANPGINNSRFFDFDCSGFQTINSPEWVANVHYEHVFRVQGGFELVTGVSAQMESSRYLSITYRDTDKQDSYIITDAFAGLVSPDDQWRLTAYVNNLEDKAVLANTGNRPILNATYGVLRPPRTYGVRFEVNF